MEFMNRNKQYVKQAACVFTWIVTMCFGVGLQTVSAQNNSGDEQGLESVYSAVGLNERAEEEALNGWWRLGDSTRAERMKWFNEAKFGCFVHWGVYAKAGGTWKGKKLLGYSEHLMRREKITLEEYTDSLVRPFDPVSFDADEWMRLAYEAGMRYFIITAKHHDGFAMFPSDVYPYDIRMTKMKGDPMKELADAARRYGIKFGFYYSHAFDWEHQDAPGNDWMYDNPGGDKLLHGAEWWINYPQFLPVARRYVNEKCLPQLAELVHRYHPDILWFDTPHKLPLAENLRILQYLRKIAPDVVINGRLARNGDRQYGDYTNTGDRAAYFFPTPGAWESIPTTNDSYGYNANDRSHKPVSHFIRLLASAAARGGNLLMNVGPKGDGAIDDVDIQILKGIGRWMQHSGSSLYGTVASGLPSQSWGETTLKGDSLFLHIFHYPKDGILLVNGLEGVRLNEARFLASGHPVKVHRMSASEWKIKLPEAEVACMDRVVVLRKSGDIRPSSQRLLHPGMVNELPAFEADMNSGNFQHGDGKVLRNYISNWTKSDETLSWEIKSLRSANYNLTLEYTGTGSGDAGKMELRIAGKNYPFEYEGCSANKVARLRLGTVSLKAGQHTISLHGISHQGKEFMRPVRLVLEQE